MKKVTILVFLLLAILGCSSCFYNTVNQGPADSTNSPRNSPEISEPTNDSKGTLSELSKKGFTAIDEQPADFENWGVVSFVTGTYPDGGTDKLHFYLADDNQAVLYDFPDFYGNQWSTFYELQTVAFEDVNQDGLKDILIIADYMTGVGPDGAMPFHVASIYFQKGKEFVSVPDLDDRMNEKGENGSADEVLAFTKERKINLPD